MKTVGLITLHRWYNYGSMLQAYAGNQLLNDLGYDCELIDYTPPKIDNHRSYKLYNDDEQWNDLREKYKVEISNRKKNFERFMKLYKCSKEAYSSDEELVEKLPRYDAYVTGSDQIWNVNMRIASKAYFLHFTLNPMKFAFSTSIGRCKEDKLIEYKTYIQKYRKIYMREEEGCQLIRHMCPEIEIGEMIDPTLILEMEKWNKIVPSKRLISQDYIACYATLDDELDAMMPILREIGKTKNMPIVLFGMVLPREEEGIINVVEAGPFEFIQIIRDAELLLTHSFHGTAFALNFNTPFFTYNDQLENPRKEGILKKVGLSDRIIHNKEEMIKIINNPVDFSNANTILKHEREKAKREIKTCLGE